MEVFNLSRTDIKEHLRVHIIDSGCKRVVNRLIKEERYQVGRIGILVTINNTVTG